MSGEHLKTILELVSTSFSQMSEESDNPEADKESKEPEVSELKGLIGVIAKGIEMLSPPEPETETETKPESETKPEPEAPEISASVKQALAHFEQTKLAFSQIHTDNPGAKEVSDSMSELISDVSTGKIEPQELINRVTELLPKILDPTTTKPT